MSLKHYFVLYNQVEIVAGKEFSLVLDFQWNKTYKISLGSHDYLLAMMRDGVSDEALNPALEFIQYLEELEIGFITHYPALFSEKSRVYHCAKLFDNAVLEVDQATDINIVQNFLSQLIDINVTGLSVNFIDFRKDIFQLLNDLTIDSGTRRIDVFINVPDRIIFKSVESIIERNGRFVIYYYSPLEELAWNKYFATVRLSSAVQPRTVAEPGLTLNGRVYHEGLQHNTGLHRKISLTKSGRIKNYLTHSVDFGSPAEVAIKELATNPDFTRLWNIHNDQIEHCRDCVLRYNCISNSNIIKRAGKWYKEDYCNYISEQFL